MKKPNKDYSKNNGCIDCGRLIQNRSKRCRICYAQNYLRPLYIKRQQKKYKDVTITPQAEQILLGSLLGDGTLFKHKYSPSFREIHCLNQKEYLEWKSKILNLPSNLTIINIPKNGSITNYKEIFYQTRSLPQLAPYYNLFYPYGKKVVTREILNNLHPLGLAVWYMDDGSYNKRGVTTIHTNSFPYEYHILIQNWFKKRWNISTRIGSTKSKNLNKHFLIHINQTNTQKFIKIIKPFIHKSMFYKIDFDIVAIREKNKQEYIKQKARTFCPACGNNCIGSLCIKCQYKTRIRDSIGRFTNQAIT